MKKILLTIILIALLILVVPVAFASDNVVESPNVKIVIDGKIGSYQDVPIIVNEKSLLPLRALLINLGVKNDDEHIVWNQSERSILIVKDTLKILLKIDSNAAIVNDKQVTLPVAPMIYKDKTYIPTRFVSECLLKKVVWDGSTSTILIRDEKDFNQVKAILDKADVAMSDINKYKLAMSMNMTMNMGKTKLVADVNVNTAYDKLKKLNGTNMTMDMLGQKKSTEVYTANNITYSKDPKTASWQKKKLSEEEVKKTFSNNTSKTSNESLCAGLMISEGINKDEIVLKGDVYFEELFNSIGKSATSGSKLDINKFNMEITVNKITNVVTKIRMNLIGAVQTTAGMIDTNWDISCIFSDFNGNFEIVIPKDAIDNATEI